MSVRSLSVLIFLLMLSSPTLGYRFLPKPSLSYEVEPGYESCGGFVGFVNTPIHQVINQAEDDLHLNHMVFLHHGSSFCFNGIVETANGIVQTRPFRVSFDRSRHLTRLLSKSERLVLTTAKEIHFRRVEDHYYDITIDTKKLIEDAHQAHPECVGINIREVTNAIGVDIIMQCITTEKPADRIWLLQTNQEGYEHHFAFTLQSPGHANVDVPAISLGKNLDMQWHLGGQLRIGYIAHRGFVQSHAMRPFLILSPDKKKLLEYKGANKPWEMQQAAPFAYVPNASAAVLYDQLKLLHGEGDHYHVLKNDPKEYQEAKINSFIFDGGYGVETVDDSTIHLAGYNMNKEIALTIETKSPIAAVIVNKGVIESIDCQLDPTQRFIKCTIDSSGKPGPCQLLLFGTDATNVDNEEPLSFHSVDTSKTHIVIVPVFGVAVDKSENPHCKRTFTVCTIYKVCQELSFEQRWLLPPFSYEGSIGDTIDAPDVTWSEFWKHIRDSIREEFKDRTDNIARNVSGLFDNVLYILLYGVLPVILVLLLLWTLIMVLINKIF